MRHQHWMYLTYKKPNILQHETPKLISGNEIPVSMLETTIQEELKSKICSEIKVIYQAKGVIFEGQTYSNSSAVVIGYETDDFKFGKVEGVVSAMGTPYIYYKKLLTVGFSHHYNSYEVHESEIFGLSKISDLYSYHPLGIYNIKDCDCYLIPLMFYLRPPE